MIDVRGYIVKRNSLLMIFNFFFIFYIQVGVLDGFGQEPY